MLVVDDIKLVRWKKKLIKYLSLCTRYEILYRNVFCRCNSFWYRIGSRDWTRHACTNPCLLSTIQSVDLSTYVFALTRPASCFRFLFLYLLNQTDMHKKNEGTENSRSNSTGASLFISGVRSAKCIKKSLKSSLNSSMWCCHSSFCQAYRNKKKDSPE